MSDRPDVEQRFQKAEDIVREAMEQEKKCRNSDRFLIWYIYRHIFDSNLNNYNEFKELPASETLTRCRRIIQNDQNDLLPTDPDVLAKRKQKEEAVREYFGKNSTYYNEWRKRQND